MPELRFPLQGGLTISWAAAERAYRAYASLFGTSQSLARLGERGGFGILEFAVLYNHPRLGHPFGNLDEIAKSGRLEREYFDRILDLVGQVAVLRYYLGAACDYAEGGHVPPADVVAYWREVIRREAGGVEAASAVGDDDGARRHGAPGLETREARSTRGAPSSSEVGR